jgi:RNA polymerase sigma-70 factor (ECF subfamily)
VVATDVQAGVARADATAEELTSRIYAEHGAFLLAFVQRLTGGDRHWAEDVIQETLLRAWRHADELNSGLYRSLRPWLTTVARRIVISDWHRRRELPTEVDDAMLNTLATDDHIERMLQRSVVVNALRKIAPVHRQVIVELYLRGRTVEEVTMLLAVPRGTVKSRTYYALRALRAELRAGVNQVGDSR